MYLKELTLRGFKSFASATTLRFEPGITAVVGPNGSGKSNIVDALAWVMGEQGAKALRGTSMEDVIFAGTSTKPPLGRAQVSLTIDNSDRALDIDYTEVTITRTIFRNGGSEYAINGSSCRLLDIQELLSDTGLGQQMHVIVGQGQLDAILRADPSGHRAFIEEAAGILKHRKRKERALRKLSNTETNLSRLDDLLGEIHRQLGPLGRQARVSRRADGIQVTLRDAQARIYADDAVKVQQSLNSARTQLGELRSQLTDRQRSLARVKMRIEQVEALAQDSNPQIAHINQLWHDLTQVQERYTSLLSLTQERIRSVQGQMEQMNIGPDPELLTRRAHELEEQEAQQNNALADCRLVLDQSVEMRASQEKQLAAARQTLTELQQTSRQRDAQLASLQTLVAKEESALQLAQERLTDGRREQDSINVQIEQAIKLEQELDLQYQSHATQDDKEALEQAEQAKSLAKEQVNLLEDDLRQLHSQIIALQAKADALTDTLQSRSAMEQLVEDKSIPLLGRLADYIQVEEGWEEPIAHALADYSGAMLVSNADGLLAALDKVHRDRLGKAVLLAPLKTSKDTPSNDASGTMRSAASLVTARESAGRQEELDGILEAVRTLLSRVAVVESRKDAQKLMADNRSLDQEQKWDKVVTRDGDVFEASGAVGGTASATSDLALVARRDKAIEQSKALQNQVKGKETDLEQAQQALRKTEDALEETKAKRTESRLQAEQSKKALADAREQLQSLQGKLNAFKQRIDHLQEEELSHKAKLEDVRTALENAEQTGSQEVNVDQLTDRARELEEALDSARAKEMKAQIRWNEAQQKAQSLSRQAKLLLDQARDARERRERIVALNQKRQQAVKELEAIRRTAQMVLGLLDHSLEQAISEKDRLQSQVSSHDSELKDLRVERGNLEPQVEHLREQEHKLDVDRERLATQIGQVSQKISDDLGMSVEEVIKDYGPDQAVPVLDETGMPVPVQENDEMSGQEIPEEIEYQTVPYEREEQIKRLNKARKDLAALGKVNPLAAEEYESLKQRNQYLNDQRQDVIHSRDDLLNLVKDLDKTMIDVFKSAFDDTATAFEQMFATLFPGGQGSLRLENPDDLLTTGVLVEASPAGKKVRQLSLLSGGERSLTALALLFAIFTARPSPFYVMDEVEAALDDVNLSRLLNAFNQLRERAQLIIITHQQRTMSIADALYGVTMRADGVTAVISQKLVQGQELEEGKTN